jgi:hypothetical protein
VLHDFFIENPSQAFGTFEAFALMYPPPLLPAATTGE